MTNLYKLSTLTIVTLLSLLVYKANNNEYDARHMIENNRINTNNEIKNVILFIGDGMGPSHVEAAGIRKGSPLCFWDENNSDWTYHGYSNTDSLTSNGFYLDTSKTLLNPLYNDTLYDNASSPYGASGNYMSNTCYTDSAAGGTALATGYKTTNAAISMNPLGEDLPTLVEIARGMNKKAGVVSSDTLDGATPASFISHVPERHLAEDIIKDGVNSGANLLMSVKPDEWSSTFDTLYKNNGYNVSTNWDNASINSEKEIILFDHLLAGSTLTPSLSDLTVYALDKLDNDNGFFLMVEGANIDKAAHEHQSGKMIQETLDFERAIQTCASWANGRDDTLIVVTADHETGAIYFDKEKANKNNIIDEVKFLSYNHSRTRVPVSVYGDASEFFLTYENYLTKQGPIDKGLETENHNYIDNTDIFKLCVSYL